MGQRSRLVINAGNLLEFIGAACLVYGMDRLLGLAWAFIVGGILLVAVAELIFDAKVWRLPLPLRPHPRRWSNERRQAFDLWWTRRSQRRHRQRVLG